MNPWPFGQRIAELRRDRGIKSARAAARLAGVDEAVWRRLESGVVKLAGGNTAPYRPSVETVHAAARALEADPGELFELLPADPSQTLPATPELVPSGSDVEQRLADLTARVEALESSYSVLAAQDVPRLRATVARLGDGEDRLAADRAGTGHEQKVSNLSSRHPGGTPEGLDEP